MPILFDDPFHERDMLAAIDKVSAKFKSYQDFFNTPLGEQKGLNIIETTTAFPGFGKTLATNIGMYVDNPTQSKAVQDLNEENSLSRVSEEAALWKELSEKHNAWGDEWEMNMAIAPIEFWTGGLARPGKDGVYKSRHGRQNLENVKFGDIQYGVWASQAWDALMQNFGGQGKWSALAPLPGFKMGRSQAYVRDLILYDFKRMFGATPKQAQNELSIDVRYTQVDNIGEFKSVGGQLRKYVDMFQEAHDAGGQTIFNAMWKEMYAGRPINFNRDHWMRMVTLAPEKDPRYQDLVTSYGYTPEEARKIFYKYVGRPLKAPDVDGEIHYTSLDNPSRIHFFAGRHHKFGGHRFKFTLGFNQNRQKAVYDSGEEPLLLYSPGRYQASFVAPVGTKAFRNISGTVDFYHSIAGEVIGSKGAKGAANLFKNLRRINPALNAVDKSIDFSRGRKIIGNNPEGLADDVLDEVGDAVDGGLPGDITEEFMDPNTGLWKQLRTKHRNYRTSTKERREYSFFGKVPMLFRETKDDIISTPFQMEFYQSLVDAAKKFNRAELTSFIKSNPQLRNLHDDVLTKIERYAVEGNINKLKDIHGKLIDTGVTVSGGTKVTFQGKMLPKGAAFFRNKLSREMFKKGRSLADVPNPNSLQRATSRVLMAVGNEKAAYKSLGGHLGRGLRIGQHVTGRTIGLGLASLRLGPKALGSLMHPVKSIEAIDKKYFKLYLPDNPGVTVIDNADEAVKRKINYDVVKEELAKLNIFDVEPSIPFEQYLGFSSNLYSNTNPYMRSLLSPVPDYGIKGLNKNTAMEQLVSHMTVAGYSANAIGKRVHQFRNLDFRKKYKVSEFMIKQAEMDIAMVKRIKGKEAGDRLAEEVAKQFGKQDELKDLTAYFIRGSDESAEAMAHPGNHFSGVERSVIPGRKEDWIFDSGTGHLLSEFAENVQGFVDYRLIRRALGPLYTNSASQKGMFVNAAKTFASPFKAFGSWGNYHRLWWKQDSLVTPEFTGLLHTQKLSSDALTILGDYYTRRVFKPIVLLRIAFLSRVFLEEQARFAAGALDSMFTHPIHYIQWVQSGKVARKKAIDAGKIVDGELKLLSKAELDSVKLMQSYEHFEAVQKTFSIAGLQGRDGKAARALNFRRVRKGHDNYVEALRFELLQLRNDPLSRAVARWGYGSKELNTFVSSPQGKKILEDIANWGGKKWHPVMYDKDFLDQYLQSIEARIRIKTGGSLSKTEYFKNPKIEGRYRYNITNSDGLGDVDLRRFISDGDLRDVNTGKLKTFIPEDVTKGDLTRGRPSTWGNKRNLDEMLSEYVSKTGRDLDMGDLKFATEIEDAKALGKKYDAAVNYAFNYLMTKPIGYLNRSVAFKQYRYQYLISNWADIQKPARTRFIDEATELNVPSKIIDELEYLSDTVAVNKGAMDFTLANNSSKAFGLAGTKNLLYDTSKKHLISDITRNIFPFPEIWFEVATTWGKLIAEKPYMLRQAHVGIRAGENWMTDGSTERGEGWIAPNPQNPNEKMFVWPFSGFLSSLVYGGQGVNEKAIENLDPNQPEQWTETMVASKAYLSGVNLLGQGFVPGPNPMVGFALDLLVPTEGWRPEIKETLFGGFLPPEGEEGLKSIFGGVIPVPPWFKKILAAIGPDSEESDYYNYEFEQMRAASTIQVYRYGMITGQNRKLYEAGELDIYLDEIDRNWRKDDPDINAKVDEAFLLYSKRKAKQLFFFQSLAQFMLPTGFTPTYYVKDVPGNYWAASVLADEYRKILIENENRDTDAAEDFINMYGLEHGWLTAPAKVSKAGRENYSYRVLKWKEENKELISELKLTSWLVLPENPAELRASWDLQPEKTQLTPDEFRRHVNDTIGYFRYQNWINQLENLNLNSRQMVVAKRFMRDELILNLPGFQEGDWGLPENVSSQDMFYEMRTKWLKNKTVMSMDTGKGFERMLNEWVQFEEVSMQLSPTQSKDWWLTSTKEEAVFMRMMMNQLAQEIIRDYPEFYHVWTSVMLKLFRDDKELLMDMADE
tara:strand:+ start:1378 stop:7401 length:6024 start_codon:yes stop_codon:yes gene_type:complete